MKAQPAAKPPTEGPLPGGFALSAFVRGWPIMPTDLGVASERKRKAARAQEQTEVMILLVFVIISLAMLVLLVADQSFSKATTEMMCLF
jgi:hypothetical protein